jgi:hypothetical protein
VSKRFFSILLPLTTLIACESAPVEPPKGLPHALATSSCGPTDEPGVAIYLSAGPVEVLQPLVPFVRVHVPALEFSVRAGQVWRVGTSGSEATGWLYRRADEPIIAYRGEIGFTETASSEVRGYVDLSFTNGTRIRGRFNAVWEPRPIVCG